jgi:hypothetical protein
MPSPDTIGSQSICRINFSSCSYGFSVDVESFYSRAQHDLVLKEIAVGEAPYKVQPARKTPN